MDLKKQTLTAEYSREEVEQKEHLCYLSVCSRDFGAIAKVAPESADAFSGFSCANGDEIKAHLHSYTEKILLIEEKERIFGIIPSLYPSSTLCVAFVGEDSWLSGADTLRLAAEEEYRDSFVFSPNIRLTPSRMSDRLISLKPRFSSFFDELSDCFFNMDAMTQNLRSSAKEELVSRIYAISNLVGCPVDIIYEGGDEADYSKTDIPLFVAFLTSFLACARANAPLRRARVVLDSMSSAANVSVCFESLRTLTLSSLLVEWESLSADRNMMFSYSKDQQNVSISFHPLRRDWSYLGLKQKTVFFE